jgi:hypothetical protein
MMYFIISCFQALEPAGNVENRTQKSLVVELTWSSGKESAANSKWRKEFLYVGVNSRRDAHQSLRELEL